MMNYDNIYNEIINIDNIKVKNKKYYIGMCFLLDNHFIYENKIPNKIFYKYKNSILIDYLIEYSSIEPNWRRLEIIKIDIKTDLNGFKTYNCILKTYYIRLVQRTWKRVFKELKNIINNTYLIINYIKQREIGLIKRLILPGLNGMLKFLKKN